MKKIRIDVLADAVRLMAALESDQVPLLVPSSLSKSQDLPLESLEKARLPVAVVLAGLGSVPVISDVGQTVLILVESSMKTVFLELAETAVPAGDQVKLLVEV